jgi:hypothetical protein
MCVSLWELESKYILLSCHQNLGQNRDVKIANRSFENGLSIWGRQGQIKI